MNLFHIGAMVCFVENDKSYSGRVTSSWISPQDHKAYYCIALDSGNIAVAVPEYKMAEDD